MREFYAIDVAEADFINISTLMDVPAGWSPDSKAVVYVDNRDGVSNLWSHTLDERPARQITHFTNGTIFNFTWSQDGKQLYLARGSVNSDVVLISNVK